MSENTKAAQITKAGWIDKHARSILMLWAGMQSPLDVDPNYLQHIKEELESCFEDPLKRSLIETSYPAD
ncbi:hypothetical protein STSP2_02700 [Anaerohalosphaera lusitana]|uniref:Uncharacterized protein n=1 Tax=Anaerohalosphaera lusitana TaxID=1936003 RepID=A0A1U9NNP0_9BACT|nr:hypothetical protein [Anaerohalosphaera lusitana]AQT69509.1 hypothetical protein STSP2_02700 [Anaerohalosphaera lusitana]